MEQQKQENKRGHTLFFLLFFFILSLAITILGVFCLNELHDNFLLQSWRIGEKPYQKIKKEKLS